MRLMPFHWRVRLDRHRDRCAGRLRFADGDRRARTGRCGATGAQAGGGTGAPRESGATIPLDRTGLFGTSTGFGSIERSGLDVELPQSLAFTEEPLDIGSTVLVESVATVEGLQARRVQPFLPLVSRIDALAREPWRLEVLGVPVTLDRQIQVVHEVGEALPLDALEPGDRVALSGLWRDRRLFATRIERLPPQGESAMRGLLVPGTADGEIPDARRHRARSRLVRCAATTGGRRGRGAARRWRASDRAARHWCASAVLGRGPRARRRGLSGRKPG